MAFESLLREFFFAGIFAFLLFSWYRKKDSLLDAIPTVGFSDPLLSYFSALYFNIDGVRMFKEGYGKASRGLFKVAALRTWLVLAADPELIDDIRKAPDDLLSQHEPLEDFLQMTYTLDFLDKHDFYHEDIIRSKLIRGLPAILKDVNEEIALALDDSIPAVGEEWVKIPIVPMLQRVICRISNRVFVGAPLCRNHDYQTLNLTFAINVVKFAAIIRPFPNFLRPLVMRVISSIPSQFKQEREFIRPMFEERLAKMDDPTQGDWDDGPNDMLMWLMNEAKGIEKSLDGVARRMLTINFAAIHTTSITFTQILYHLLANPEYIEPLRQDAEAAVAAEGWTKEGLDRMHKVDSFVRESQRVDGLGILVLARLAMRPFTFSNGMTIPAGTLVAAPLSAIHTDEEKYSNPEEFDGFRFAKLRENSEGLMASRHQAGTTSTAYLPFGHGRLACPGRFFAVAEIKALLAYMVMTYDIKLEEGKQVPRQLCIGTSLIPGNADVLFRKRQK